MMTKISRAVICVLILFLFNCSDPQLKVKKDEAKLLADKAYRFQARGKYDEAIDTFKQAIEMCRDFKDRESSVLLVNFNSQIGEIYFRKLNNTDKAIAYYKEAVAAAAAGRLKKHPQTFIPHMGLADCYFQRKEYRRAIDYYNKALTFVASISPDPGRNPAVARIQLQTGDCLKELGQYDKAMTFYKKSLDYCEKYLKKDSLNTKSLREKISLLRQLMEGNQKG